MKSKIEAWFRRIVSEEVKIARDDFHGVAQRFEADTEDIEAKFTAGLKSFEVAFEHRLLDIEVDLVERLEVVTKKCLDRFEAKAASMEKAVSKQFDHWQTDEEVRKADEALIHPKQKRR